MLDKSSKKYTTRPTKFIDGSFLFSPQTRTVKKKKDIEVTDLEKVWKGDARLVHLNVDYQKPPFFSFLTGGFISNPSKSFYPSFPTSMRY